MKIEELLEIVEKMTDSPWCWSIISIKDNGYIIGSACDLNDEPYSGFVEIDVVLVDPVMIGEHEAATCNYSDPEGIVALKNHAPRIITELQVEIERLRSLLNEVK